MENMYDSSWSPILKPLFADYNLKKLSHFIQIERARGTVFPAKGDVFNAFKLTKFDDIKVVILGQDPYHNDGQAHGLSFSVPHGMQQPPSLKNIFKELLTDIPGFTYPKHGDLSTWAKQGVLLLNATLTVRAHQAASHQKQGWEEFTDAIIKKISDEKEGVVFLLWGSYAQKKTIYIDERKHLVLKSVHPSPLSVYRGFFGCKHFSQTNLYLQKQNKNPINWQVD